MSLFSIDRFKLKALKATPETRDNNTAILNWANDIIAPAVIPPGAIIFWGTLVECPEGWVPCDGTSYLRTVYPELFAVLGAAYGAADAYHFNVPDMRARMPVGASTSAPAGLTAKAAGASGGTESHSITTAELPAHTHGITAGVVFSPGLASVFIPGGGIVPISVAPAFNTDPTGSGAAFANISPYVALSCIIKF